MFLLLVIILSRLILGKKYFAGGVCEIEKDLTGQVVVITGANTGIGKETARKLAKMKATIVLACRDAKKTLQVAEELKKETGNSKIEFMQLDLSDLSSIKKFAEEFKKKYQSLNILINNAGVMFIPKKQLTKDGFEMQFGTNHLGHFYLTKLLMDVIERSGPSRIINVSSMAHYSCRRINWDDLNSEKSYSQFSAYFYSKLFNVLFSQELQHRYGNKNFKAVSLHPGAVRTELARNIKTNWLWNIIERMTFPLMKAFGKSPLEGAQTSLYCALEDQDKLVGGAYYSDCKVKKENVLAFDRQNAKKLWDVSEAMIEKALKRID